jgi:hypothetical protein
VVANRWWGVAVPPRARTLASEVRRNRSYSGDTSMS